MKFALLAYEPQDLSRTPEEAEVLLADYGRVAQALADSGALVWGDAVGGNATASVIRNRDVLTEGPVIEGREHLVGVFIIEVESEADARAWAARMPHADGDGAVEIRPVGA